MKWNRGLHKATALLMACVMLGAAQGQGLLQTLAADYNIMVEDKNDKSLRSNADVIAGEQFNIITKLPSSYALDAANPFLITRGNSAVAGDMAEGVFVSTTTDRVRYTSTAQLKALLKDGETDGVDLEIRNKTDTTAVQTYTVQGNYTATGQSSGSGTATGKNPAGTQISYAVEGLCEPGVPLVKASTISFEVSAGQSEPGSSISIDETSVVITGGYFEAFYTGGTLVPLGVSTSGGKTTLKLSLNAPAGGEKSPVTLTYTFTNPPSVQVPTGETDENGQEIMKTEPYVIATGTKFTMTFYRPDDVQPLIVRVHGSRNAVEIEKNSLTSNMIYSGDAASTGEDGKKYITLSTGDTMDAIRNNFSVRTVVPRYNSQLDIKWTWQPDSKDENGDEVSPETQNSYKSKVIIDNGVVKLIDLPQENMCGYLVAVISHSIKGVLQSTGDEIKIPIKVLGTGTKPYIKNDAWVVGSWDTATNAQKDKDTQISNPKMPEQMDVYDGGVSTAIYSKQPTYPYQFRATAYYGIGQGKAEKLVVEKTLTTGGGDVDLFFGQGAAQSPYDWGKDLPNDAAGNAEYAQSFRVRATHAGTVVLTFKYYNSAGYAFTTMPWTITIEDTSPSPDPSLKSLTMRAKLMDDATEEAKKAFNGLYPGGVVDFGFSPETLDYPEIQLPNAVDQLFLKPVYTELSSEADITITWGTEADERETLKSNHETTTPIKLTENVLVTIRVKCLAQDGTPRDYVLRVRRMPKSDVNTLSDIIVRPNKNSPEEDNFVLTPEFQSDVTGTYTLSVPYSQSKVNVKAIATDAWASTIKIEKQGDAARNSPLAFLARIFQRNEEKDIELDYSVDTNGITHNVTTVLVTVTPEESGTTDEEAAEKSMVYTLQITRRPPSENNLLNSLVVYEDRGQETVIPFADNQTFNKTDKEYTINVKYSMKFFNIELSVDDPETAREIRVTAPDVLGGRVTTFQSPKEAVIYRPDSIAQSNPPNEQLNDMKFKIEVQAENEEYTDPPYYLRVIRLDPEEENRLTNLEVTNSADSTPVDTFSFNPQKTEYDFEVPFTTEGVFVTPTVKSALSSVTVDDKIINATVPSREVKLKENSVTTILVVCTAESGAALTYKLNIKRLAPGTEARLMSLDVAGLKFLPEGTLFVPDTLNYRVEIPAGTKGVTVTAVPVDPNATFTVEGKAAVSGQASAAITPTTANSKITIVVTAQDGKTKKTYIVNVKDYNYIKKSDDPLLSNILVQYGDLSPRFSSTATDYEVYVKPETMSVTLTPKKRNSGAKIEASMGSKKLSEKSGGYTISLIDDQVDVEFKVTSEDETKTETYTVSIYRNDEEKMGIFNPITDDMVNYETSDPIVIDISKYPIVSAEVFNTLKTDYPDKTVLFKGNDYTLEMQGKDIDTLVPNTEQYDLRFNFSSPDEDDIEDLLDEYDGNNRIDPVYIYFDHHGTLPGPMKLTVSLGREYRNEKLYWNYYNSERDRIDYYGYVTTNSKGTFTVPITHLSTYMVTEYQIRGAENKFGVDYGGASTQTEDIGSVTTTGKQNPNTGAKDGRS